MPNNELCNRSLLVRGGVKLYRLCCVQLGEMRGQIVYSPLATCVRNQALVTGRIQSDRQAVLKPLGQANFVSSITHRLGTYFCTHFTDSPSYLSLLSTPPTITTTTYINIVRS